NWTGRHRAHHVLRDHATDGESEEHIGARHSLGQRTQLGVLREALLVRIHACRAALVNHSLGVAQSDVLPLHAQPNVVLGSGNARGAGPVDDKGYFADVLANHFQGVQQRSSGNNGGAVLVVVEDRNLHRLLQGLFDVEALRSLDVFEVDTAEGRLQKLAYLDDIVGIVAADLDIKDIYVGETFEEDGLALHDGLAGEGPDVAQPENGGSVGHHGDQVPAARVLEGVLRILLNRQAWYSDARRIGQAQIPLRPARFCGCDLNFSWARQRMVIECLLFGECHDFLLEVPFGRRRVHVQLANGIAAGGRPL